MTVFDSYYINSQSIPTQDRTPSTSATVERYQFLESTSYALNTIVSSPTVQGLEIKIWYLLEFGVSTKSECNFP